MTQTLKQRILSESILMKIPDSRISIGEFEVIGFFESFEVGSFSVTESDLSTLVGLTDFERDRLSKRALFDFELEATELWRDEIFDFDVTVTSGSLRLVFFESILCFSLFRLFERLFSIFESFSGFFGFLSEVFFFRLRFFFLSSSLSLELDDELEDELEIDFAFFFNFFLFSLSFAFNLCLED